MAWFRTPKCNCKNLWTSFRTECLRGRNYGDDERLRSSHNSFAFAIAADWLFVPDASSEMCQNGYGRLPGYHHWHFHIANHFNTVNPNSSQKQITPNTKFIKLILFIVDPLTQTPTQWQTNMFITLLKSATCVECGAVNAMSSGLNKRLRKTEMPVLESCVEHKTFFFKKKPLGNTMNVTYSQITVNQTVHQTVHLKRMLQGLNAYQRHRW